jgi:hypothetical protein
VGWQKEICSGPDQYALSLWRGAARQAMLTHTLNRHDIQFWGYVWRKQWFTVHSEFIEQSSQISHFLASVHKSDPGFTRHLKGQTRPLAYDMTGAILSVALKIVFNWG